MLAAATLVIHRSRAAPRSHPRLSAACRTRISHVTCPIARVELNANPLLRSAIPNGPPAPSTPLMAYNYNSNRHNSVGGSWQLPPPPPQPPISSGAYSDSPAMVNHDFRNPWFSAGRPGPQQSGAGPMLMSNSPTKTPQLPLLQAQVGQQPKRLSLVNQLPTTYEDETQNNGPFIHPPTRVDNPFNQYYTNQDVTLDDRRMSVADGPYLKSGYNGFAELGAAGGVAGAAIAPPYGQPSFNNLRRSSLAVGPFADGGLGYRKPGRSASVVQYQQYQQSVVEKQHSYFRLPAPRAKRVHSKLDLHPKIHHIPKYRRASVNSVHISPVNALSIYLTETYRICQPKKFQYSKLTNPKRVLTKPLEPKYNNGYDNEDSDYILYVNDVLGTEEGRKYIVLDLLGSGTFGQVVKCQNLSNQSVCAIKVIKSKPAYMNQSLTEVRLLEFLNTNSNGNHFIRLFDTFMHKEHLCLVFELLASNLYELIKQNQFQGLNMRLVKLLTKQLLEAMAQLKSFQIIHCDLKPENILLCQPDKPDIKIIDFGSACFTHQTIYSYIQSRFYRSPEVILGLPYTESIDMWSLGCIVGELFLGLPMFPGTSEYNQIWKIVDMLGYPPRHMIDVGRNSTNFFHKVPASTPEGKHSYTIKSYDEYVQYLASTKGKEDQSQKEQKNKNYFKHRLMKDIILNYKFSSKMTNTMIEKECQERLLLVDFLTKCLNMNPLERLTPQEALKHPFVNDVMQPLTPTPQPEPHNHYAPRRASTLDNRTQYSRS